MTPDNDSVDVQGYFLKGVSEAYTLKNNHILFVLNPNKAYFCRTMELIVQSTYFTLYQCDQQRCFSFQVAHKSVMLTFCQLLNLRNRVNAMDLEAHFDGERNPNGLEILTFCNRRHLIVLNTYEVIDLKEMMQNAFAILQGPCIPELAI